MFSRALRRGLSRSRGPRSGRGRAESESVNSGGPGEKKKDGLCADEAELGEVAEAEEVGLGCWLGMGECEDGDDDVRWPELLSLFPLLLVPAPSIGFRQMGHVLCSLSQRTTHSPWYQCLQGKTTTSSPFFISSMQMVHSTLPSGPSISSSTFFFSRFPMAVSDAGGAALVCGDASMSCVTMRSRASWVKTASPWTAAAGLYKEFMRSWRLPKNGKPKPGPGPRSRWLASSPAPKPLSKRESNILCDS